MLAIHGPAQKGGGCAPAAFSVTRPPAVEFSVTCRKGMASGARALALWAGCGGLGTLGSKSMVMICSVVGCVQCAKVGMFPNTLG